MRERVPRRRAARACPLNQIPSAWATGPRKRAAASAGIPTAYDIAQEKGMDLFLLCSTRTAKSPNIALQATDDSIVFLAIRGVRPLSPALSFGVRAQRKIDQINS